MILPGLFNEINESYKERLASPFFRNFFISFIVINWRPIYYLFSSNDEAIDKIIFIDQKFNSNFSVIWCPLLYALLITILVPSISFIIDYPINYIKSLRKRETYKVIGKSIDDKSKYVDGKKINAEKRREELLKQQVVNEALAIELKKNEHLSKEIKDYSSKNSLLLHQYENTKKALDYFKKYSKNEAWMIDDESGAEYWLFKKELIEITNLTEKLFDNKVELNNLFDYLSSSKNNLLNLYPPDIKNKIKEFENYLVENGFLYKNTDDSISFSPKGFLLRKKLVEMKYLRN